jgi:hypothetical protein
MSQLLPLNQCKSACWGHLSHTIGSCACVSYCSSCLQWRPVGLVTCGPCMRASQRSQAQCTRWVGSSAQLDKVNTCHVTIDMSLYSGAQGSQVQFTRWVGSSVGRGTVHCDRDKVGRDRQGGIGRMTWDNWGDCCAREAELFSSSSAQGRRNNTGPHMWHCSGLDSIIMRQPNGVWAPACQLGFTAKFCSGGALPEALCLSNQAPQACSDAEELHRKCTMPGLQPS